MHTIGGTRPNQLGRKPSRQGQRNVWLWRDAGATHFSLNAIRRRIGSVDDRAVELSTYRQCAWPVAEMALHVISGALEKPYPSVGFDLIHQDRVFGAGELRLRDRAGQFGGHVFGVPSRMRAVLESSISKTSGASAVHSS